MIIHVNVQYGHKNVPKKPILQIEIGSGHRILFVKAIVYFLFNSGTIVNMLLLLLIWYCMFFTLPDKAGVCVSCKKSTTYIRSIALLFKQFHSAIDIAIILLLFL